MSSLNAQSLLVLAVCAQLVALGLTELMYPYGTAEGDSTVGSYSHTVLISPPIRVFGADSDRLDVSI